MMATATSRTALVTGASGGIGRATVRALLDQGLTVYAAVRRPGSVADLVAAGACEVALDVTDEESMRAAVSVVEAAHGHVDVLVNNAGFAVASPIEELDPDALRSQLEVNVVGLMRLTQLVLPAMRDHGSGRIINIGSVGGLFTAPGAGAYHMSKYALEALSDALRVEIRRFGIDVVLLEPTGVRTSFADTQLATMPDTGPESPYATFKASMDTGVRALFEADSRAVVTPEQVARVVTRAATTSRPRARYKVGAVAHVLPRLRRIVGDRGWDAMAARQFAAE
jgi:NAD(P)-dependent dehydrogenase (short-subunit alcohol dehydrogenase family)